MAWVSVEDEVGGIGILKVIGPVKSLDGLYVNQSRANGFSSARNPGHEMAFHKPRGDLQVGGIEVLVDIDIGRPSGLPYADQETLILAIVIEDCELVNDLFSIHLDLLLMGAGPMHPRPNNDFNVLPSYSLGF